MEAGARAMRGRHVAGATAKASGIVLCAAVVSCAGRAMGQLPRAPATASPGERVAFYMERLGDPRYVEYGPEPEAPVAWHVAPAELGQMGVTAIPPLIERLNACRDDFEREQIFYALRLAVQNPNAQPSAGSDYPMPVEAFPGPETHESLKGDWMRWWREHGGDV